MPHPTKIFRRNTSGIIGLRKEAESAAAASDDPTAASSNTSKPLLVQSNSSNICPATLEIRETAARRISAHEPPSMDLLEITTKTDEIMTSTPKPKIRKTSEIVRPNFSIYEERESQGMFVSGILNERSDGSGSNRNPASNNGGVTFSFMTSMREDSGKDLDLLDDFSSIDLNESSGNSSSDDERMSTENNDSPAPKFSFVGRFDLHGRRDSSEDIMHNFPRF